MPGRVHFNDLNTQFTAAQTDVNQYLTELDIKLVVSR